MINLTKEELIDNFNNAISYHVQELANEGEIDSAYYFENKYFQLVDVEIDQANDRIKFIVNKQFRGNKYESREEIAAWIVAYALNADYDECLDNILQVKVNTVLVKY